MSEEGILVFTFSPVQSFITESRRTADLFAGSRILVELSQAAGAVLHNESKKRRLVYPASLNSDAPNKLVAILPLQDGETAAKEARQAFLARWKELTDGARDAFLKKASSSARDATWDQIWARQTAEDFLWEFYWTFAPLKGYQESYQKIEQALGGVKRTRIFTPYLEEGEKDFLSGAREALHTKNTDARHYWTGVVKNMRYGHLIQPGGRECLDAVGVTKRFVNLARSSEPFASTSTIASRAFSSLIGLSANGKALLEAYGNTLDSMGISRMKEKDWHFDGDFFYEETLTARRLEDDYGLENISPEQLEKALRALKAIYKEVKSSPCSYYAIIMMDGDSMGEALSKCSSEAAHRNFSQKLEEFAASAQKAFDSHLAMPVYTGGDDVLVLTPLAEALPLASELAVLFHKITGQTVSAGIAVAHHRSPLAAALRTAREAEGMAKSVPGKGAVCLRIMKRGGEEVAVTSKWGDLKDYKVWVNIFKNREVSTRVAYEILNEAHTVTWLGYEARVSEMRRLLKRHSQKTSTAEGQAQEQTDKFTPEKMDELAQDLGNWAASLDKIEADPEDNGRGLIHLGFWLTVARFVALGGEE